MPLILDGTTGLRLIETMSIGNEDTTISRHSSGVIAVEGGVIPKENRANTFTANQVIEVTDNTNAALRITQLGTGAAIRVEDDTNPDSTPFIVDANGNVGIGVTPSAWSGLTVLQIKGASLYSSTRELGSQSNAYYNAGWKYIDTAAASQYLQSAGEHYWYTAASGTSGNAITFTERMRIDSSGNVGIGTGSPSNFGGTNLQVQNSTIGSILWSNGTITGQLLASASAEVTVGSRSNHPLRFGTNDTERMRLDTSGNVLVGATSSITGTNTLQVVNASTDSTQIRVRNSGATAGQHWRYGTDSVNTIYIINHNSAGVYINNGGTSWSGLSDERAKDIIEPISDAASKVASLRAVIGKYKTDEDGVRRSFLIAQDVQAVLPEAVSIANQETGYLGLSYTDTIPLLTAALQEALTEISSLKARVAALEAA